MFSKFRPRGPISIERWFPVILLFFVGCLGPRCVLAIVLTEVHYHPPGTGEASRRLEFIEIFNEDPDPRDLTGFAFVDGVSFVFPERTILEGKSYLVVCADEDAIQQAYGIQNTVGNWSTVTALDNGGERTQRQMATTAYLGTNQPFGVDAGPRRSMIEHF